MTGLLHDTFIIDDKYVNSDGTRRIPLVYDALVWQSLDKVNPDTDFRSKWLTQNWFSSLIRSRNEIQDAINNNGLHGICGIRYEKFLDPPPKDVVSLPCPGRHTFCLDGIRPELERRLQCPMDRAGMREYSDTFGLIVHPAIPDRYEGSANQHPFYYDRDTSNPSESSTCSEEQDSSDSSREDEEPDMEEADRSPGSSGRSSKRQKTH